MRPTFNFSILTSDISSEQKVPLSHGNRLRNTLHLEVFRLLLHPTPFSLKDRVKSAMYERYGERGRSGEYNIRLWGLWDRAGWWDPKLRRGASNDGDTAYVWLIVSR